MWKRINEKFGNRTTILGLFIVSIWISLSLVHENSSDSGIAGTHFLYQSKYVKDLVGQPQNHILLGADFKRSKLSQCGYLRYWVLGKSRTQTLSLRLTKKDDEDWIVKEIKDGLYPVFENTCFQ